eukprot:3270861-Pleurochrysis_carterae.AAC.1
MRHERPLTPLGAPHRGNVVGGPPLRGNVSERRSGAPRPNGHEVRAGLTTQDGTSPDAHAHAQPAAPRPPTRSSAVRPCCEGRGCVRETSRTTRRTTTTDLRGAARPYCEERGCVREVRHVAAASPSPLVRLS